MTVAERQQMEARRVVAFGFEKGWITVRPPLPDVLLFRGNNKRLPNSRTPTLLKRQKRDAYIKQRDGFYARGLTAWGTKLKSKLRPELKGLTGRDYHCKYMRLWRASKKK